MIDVEEFHLPDGFATDTALENDFGFHGKIPCGDAVDLV